jgi:hypothetical protein
MSKKTPHLARTTYGSVSERKQLYPPGTTQGGEMQNLIITQQELQDLQSLEEIRRMAAARRSDIRQRVLAGALVEPGQLTVKIEERAIKALTHQNLLSVVGWKLGNAILNSLPRFKRFAMIVRAAKPRSKSKNIDPQPVLVSLE